MSAVDDLLDKQAIGEVVLRYCRGIDRLDLDLVRSAYHCDGVDPRAARMGPANCPAIAGLGHRNRVTEPAQV